LLENLKLPRAARSLELDKRLPARSGKNEGARRLLTIPGIGPITATAHLGLWRLQSKAFGLRARILLVEWVSTSLAEIHRREAEASARTIKMW
jgi:transposase